jgi:hypothetical protein
MKILIPGSGKLFTFLVLPVFVSFRCQADPGNKPVIYYFTDNIITEIIFRGGYYSVLVGLVLAIIAVVNKNFRHILLSVVLAIFGLFLVLFLYEAFSNFEWIPKLVK